MEDVAADITVVMTHNFSDQELESFAAHLSEMGKVTAKRPGGMGAGGAAIIVFLAAGVLAGFLAKLGEDLYDVFRERLKSLLLGPDRQRFSTFTVIGRLGGNLPELTYKCERSDEADLDTFFERAVELHRLLLDDIGSGLKVAGGELSAVTAWLNTTNDRQYFTRMRTQVLVSEGECLPCGCFWILEAKTDAPGGRYLTVVPTKEFSLRKISWRRWSR